MKQTIFFSLLLSLLLIANICSNAQTQLVEISKIYIKKDIPITDGLVYKYLYPNDTARYFQPGVDQYEATITFLKIGGTTPVIVNIDDQDLAVKYIGAWTKQASSTAFNSTISFSGTTGNTAKLDFTGKNITLVAENRPFHGKAGITIDAGPEEIIDMYSPTNKDQVQVLKKAFADGQHSITVRITGTRNTASTGNFVVIDQFIVER